MQFKTICSGVNRKAMKKISVIVPIYNMDKYLENCIDSIINQTYKELEIILVDDGSTDNSGEICDEYSKHYSNVFTIHKKNEGLSSARNTGLDYSTGEIISFVDSDDIILPYMYDEMMRYINDSEPQIVCCDYLVIDEFCKQVSSFLREEGEIAFLSRDEALAILLDQNSYKCYAWNKLYKRELFDNIRYPEGELFEDIFTTYRLFDKCVSIVYVKKRMYCYRIRKGSITQKAYSNRSIDIVNAINDVFDFCKLDHPGIVGKMFPGYVYYYFSYINLAYRSSVCVHEDEVLLKNLLKRRTIKVLLHEGLPILFKFQIVLFYMSTSMYKKVYCFLKNREIL